MEASETPDSLGFSETAEGRNFEALPAVMSEFATPLTLALVEDFPCPFPLGVGVFTDFPAFPFRELVSMAKWGLSGSPVWATGSFHERPQVLATLLDAM